MNDALYSMIERAPLSEVLASLVKREGAQNLPVNAAVDDRKSSVLTVPASAFGRRAA